MTRPKFRFLQATIFATVLLQAIQTSSTRTVADIVSFQRGVDGYFAVQDTYLQNNLGSADTFDQLYVRLGDNMFSTRNSLIVFDHVFGGGPSEVPFGSTIVSASLEFHTRDQADAAGGRVNFHRMLMDWNPGDTVDDYGLPPWNNQRWVQADNFEATATVGGTVLPDQINTMYQVDVTNDVQLWSNGVSNFGWVMIADPLADDDSVLFFSSDHATVSSRPRLVIEFASIPEPGATPALIGLMAMVFRRKRRWWPISVVK